MATAFCTYVQGVQACFQLTLCLPICEDRNLLGVRRVRRSMPRAVASVRVLRRDAQFARCLRFRSRAKARGDFPSRSSGSMSTRLIAEHV